MVDYTPGAFHPVGVGAVYLDWRGQAWCWGAGNTQQQKQNNNNNIVGNSNGKTKTMPASPRRTGPRFTSPVPRVMSSFSIEQVLFKEHWRISGAVEVVLCWRQMSGVSVVVVVLVFDASRKTTHSALTLAPSMHMQHIIYLFSNFYFLPSAVSSQRRYARHARRCDAGTKCPRNPPHPSARKDSWRPRDQGGSGWAGHGNSIQPAGNGTRCADAGSSEPTAAMEASHSWRFWNYQTVDARYRYGYRRLRGDSRNERNQELVQGLIRNCQITKLRLDDSDSDSWFRESDELAQRKVMTLTCTCTLYSSGSTEDLVVGTGNSRKCQVNIDSPNLSPQTNQTTPGTRTTKYQCIHIHVPRQNTDIRASTNQTSPHAHIFISSAPHDVCILVAPAQCSVPNTTKHHNASTSYPHHHKNKNKYKPTTLTPDFHLAFWPDRHWHWHGRLPWSRHPQTSRCVRKESI